MENNSDKQLRDKLSSTEFPFDPQAWEKMETMLDEKKKRRGFFWWWTGGVAAALLLAVTGYVIYEFGASNGGRAGGRQLAVGNEEKLEVKSQKSEENTIVAVVSSSNSEQPKTNLQVSASNKERTSKHKQETKNKKQSSTGAGLMSTNPSDRPSGRQGQRHQRANGLSKKIKQKVATLAHLKYEEVKALNNSVAYNANPYKKEVEMPNTASASAEENISLDRREASLLEYVSENATTFFDKKEEDVLPKQKKKIFNYSIGVLGNVTASTLGHQTSSTIRNRQVSPFASQPSYMVGLTHDFLFINRVAITNSILYSQTSFKVYSPKTISFAKTPSDYTSHITELAIPIGIKVYPVVKNNFRFYINTGIINHIKLKETFGYTMPVDTPSNLTSTPNLADNLFPTQTNFEGKGATFDALNANGLASSQDMSTADFSMNVAKRYYTSFYAGAGFEYVAKKHFILFGEPTFQMSLQKIGVQDKRKYNFGVNAGFRYQF